MADNIAAGGSADSGSAGDPNVDTGAEVKGQIPQPKAAPKEALTKKGAPEAKDSKVAAPKAPEGPRKIKLKTKFEGKEEEREYSEDELARELQLAKLGHKKASEAAELRKALTEFTKMLKENPIEALKDPAFGIDLKEMVRQQLLQEYEESIAPPEDKEKLEYRKKMEEYERKVKEYEAEREAAKQAEYQAQVDTQVRESLKEAFDVSGLPVTRENLYAMATVLKSYWAKGITPTPEILANQTHKFLDKNMSQFVGNLEGEALAKRLGDSVVQKIIKYKLEQMRKSTPPVEEQPSEPVIAPAKDEDESPRRTKRMSPEEKAAYMRSLYIGE